MSLTDRFKKGWNAFLGRDPTSYSREVIGVSSSYRPDQPILSYGVDRTIVASIYNRIALDVSQVDIIHARVDQNGSYKEPYTSGLNNALSVEANLDQTGREFIQDLVLSMFDEGVVAVVPTDTDVNPNNGAFDPQTLRVGKIIQWYPAHVKVRVYNEKTGQKEELLFHKRTVAIITNPLYAVMNQPNSTLQRLIRKLAILDAVDEQTGSGKLNMILQLPYVVKGETRERQAEKRRNDLKRQLTEDKYGIAYTDGTEKIVQLNRPIENNLLGQIEYLTNLLYSQLGLSQSVFDGTADEKTMLNYSNRTLAPILTAITDEFSRKFLTKTARKQLQRIIYIQDPFRLVPVSQIAEIADKFTRSEILSSNELRSLVGFRPVDDPQADQLRNSNLNQSPDAPPPASTNPDAEPPENANNEAVYENEQGESERPEEAEGERVMDVDDIVLPDEVKEMIRQYKSRKSK